jgi:hypothetical protein
MSKVDFGNKKKGLFLSSIPIICLDSGEIIDKCKFNFCYFDNSQKSGQDFENWSHDELIKLMRKLTNYSASSLEYWRHQRVGGGGLKVLEIYGAFPKKSDFVHPKHVPHDVSWARFRMENMARLIGFIVPRGAKLLDESKLKNSFDHNTFYVVFLDKEHKFYITESP